MKNIALVLEKIFNVLFMCFALMCFKAAMARNIFIQGTSDQIGMQKGIVILGLVLVILLSASLKNGVYWKKDFFFLFFGTLLLRCIVVLAIGVGTNQISDFGTAYFHAIGEIDLDPITGVSKEVLFPNWGAYPMYLRSLMNIFGKSALICIIANSVLAAVSSCLIYNLCRIFGKSRRMRFLAALLFCVWPSYLAYVVVLSPEHVNVMLTLLSFNILAWSYKFNFDKIIWRYILIAISGVILAIASFFKSVSLIAVMALAIILILEGIKIIKKISSIKADIVNMFTCFICFFAAYFIIMQVGYFIIEREYGYPVNRQVAYYYIATGLNVEGDGRYSSDLALQYKKDIGKNLEFEIANENMRIVIMDNLDALKDQWKNFFMEKFRLVWQSDEYMSFVIKTVNAEGYALINTEQWYPHLMGIIHYFYLAVCGCTLITAAICLYKRENEKLIFFAELLIFGLMCMLLISEAQPRYKCVIYPYWAIIVAYGIENTITEIKFLYTKIKEK